MLTGTEKGYKKAAGILKKACSFDPKDFGAMLLWGELEILTKNQTEGKKLVSKAIDLIKTIGEDIQFGDLTKIQQKYLRKSLMEYTLFIDAKEHAKAIEIISIGQPFFYEEREDCMLEDNEEFKKMYDKITG
jgi:transcription termination factor NusB